MSRKKTTMTINPTTNSTRKDKMKRGISLKRTQKRSPRENAGRDKSSERRRTKAPNWSRDWAWAKLLRRKRKTKRSNLHCSRVSKTPAWRSRGVRSSGRELNLTCRSNDSQTRESRCPASLT